ncbi:CPBP family intramembrane glutamic endopeptidase [Christiangramia sabulilitoris]|uniref:CPBP family intramembrane metalloprotease n=1 Tax=Christiangramia sabulilitoris TaxID=2583991 RepID=A0A550I832_9FLAO|nr:type II CAAX endopeptidase family protein [Christiangramia sabulilitoris]TRO67111.1 CPBP family intramembrane metalloprotease [Christiangramia sabulilitoris]
MVFLLAAIIASIFLLKLFNLKISSLGLDPNPIRFQDLLWGFTAAAVSGIMYFLLLVVTFNYKLHINLDYTFTGFLDAAWWTLRSVLIEEFLFRGGLFIIAIKVLGKHKACILSSVIFGIYHWFSYEIFGEPVQMLFTFILTGIGGLMFAYAFAETKSMYLPIALHFGWNLVSIAVFSEGPLGDQLLTTTGGEPMGYLYFVFFVYQVLVLPAFVLFYLKRRKNKESLTLLIPE